MCQPPDDRNGTAPLFATPEDEKNGAVGLSLLRGAALLILAGVAFWALGIVGSALHLFD